MTTTKLGSFTLSPVAAGVEPQPFVLAAVDRFAQGSAKFLVGGDANRIEIALEVTSSVVALVTDRGLPTEKREPLPNDDPRTGAMTTTTVLGTGSTVLAQLPAPATTIYAPTWGDEGTTKLTTREVAVLGGVKATEPLYSPRPPIGDLEVAVSARLLVRGIPHESDEAESSATVDMVQ